LAQAAQAAGADNRFLPAGLALGAFGSGLTRGMDTSQEDRIKLQMQQALQSAQAQNLLAQGGLAKAQASAVPSEIAQRQMATQYQSLVNQGYPTELAAKIAETQSRTGLYTAQAGAIPSQILETVAKTAYTQALTAGQSEQQALAAAQAALARAQAMGAQAENQRNAAWTRRLMGPSSDQDGSPVSQFNTQLQGSESSGNPNAQTPVVKGGTGGYSGLHQFGAPRLQDLGYYTPGEGDYGPDGKWTGSWNGTFKNVPVGEGQSPVKTIQDFMGNTDAQNAVFNHHVNDIDSRIRQDGLQSYIGATLPNGATVTMDGMRAAAHLSGYDGMKKYLLNGINSTDRLGTSTGDYFRKFGGASGAPAAPAQSVATPAQRAIMGGGGAAGGGFGGLGQPGYGSSAAAPAVPAPGGGFGARAGAPLNPQQSVLSGGGDVLQGMPQPVPGSPGAPGQFAGPGATTAPLNPQQSLIGGFSGPGLTGGGTMPNLGGTVPTTPVVPAPVVPPAVPGATTPAVVPGSGKFGLAKIVSEMPLALQENLSHMTAKEGAAYVANWVKDVGRVITIPAVEAQKLGIPGTAGFYPGAVLKIEPPLAGGLPKITLDQPGVAPKSTFDMEKDLVEQFKSQRPVIDYPQSKQHLDAMSNLYNKFIDKGDPSGATGAAMIIELGKIIDPSQVVRQVEGNRLETNSVNPEITALLNRYNYSGSSIGPDQARDLLNTAHEIHNGRLETVTTMADEMRQRARDWSVNPEHVVGKNFPGAATNGPAANAPAPFTPEWISSIKSTERFGGLVRRLDSDTLTTAMQDPEKVSKLSTAQKTFIQTELKRRQEAAK
jgi:hypothetical protein